MMLRRLRATLIGIGVIGALGLAGIIASGFALSAPSQGIVGLPPSGLPVESVEIPSRSGSVLRSWWLPRTPGQGVVVLMHGVRADRRQVVPRMLLLHEAGYSLLAFDFQAHGESPGRRITFGRLEGLDAAAAVAFAHDRSPRERLAVIGISLGGAAALLAPDPLPVNALVLESVFPDIESATANRLESYLGSGGRLLAPIYMALMPVVLGFDAGQLRPIDRIAALRAPVLIMSGAEDPYTTIAEARALYDRAHEPKVFWAAPGASHVDLYAFAPADYRRQLMPFLASYLR